MLGDVAILTAFYFAIAGIACVELFGGKFYNRCGVPNFYRATNATLDDNAVLGVRGI